MLSVAGVQYMQGATRVCAEKRGASRVRGAALRDCYTLQAGASIAAAQRPMPKRACLSTTQPPRPLFYVSHSPSAPLPPAQLAQRPRPTQRQTNDSSPVKLVCLPATDTRTHDPQATHDNPPHGPGRRPSPRRCQAPEAEGRQGRSCHVC